MRQTDNGKEISRGRIHTRDLENNVSPVGQFST